MDRTAGGLPLPGKTAFVPMTGADGFVRALNRMMRRSGQGPLLGQSVLVLESSPKEIDLRASVTALIARHPVLHAKPGKAGFFTPAWVIVRPRREAVEPLAFWQEDTPSCPSLAVFQERLLNSPLCESGSHWNVRFDLVACRDGSATLLFTWAHLLLDGKGAERLLSDLARGHPHPPQSSATPTQSDTRLPLGETFGHLKKMAEHFTEISKIGFRSFSGPGARPGRLRFHLLTFNGSQSRHIAGRAAEFCSPLFNIPFYLSCACRAADKVLHAKGVRPRQYVVSVPAHLRKKGGESKDLFHNKLTMLFFRMMPEALSSLEGACRDAFEQFANMSREGLDKSFHISLNVMKLFHPGAYMRFVLLHGRGEIVSFFHSYTGEFFNSKEPFLGRKVTNAYHIPSVSTPPGVGIFFGEHLGRLNVTISWREGVLEEREVATLSASLAADLTGEDPPQL